MEWLGRNLLRVGGLALASGVVAAVVYGRLPVDVGLDFAKWVIVTVTVGAAVVHGVQEYRQPVYEVDEDPAVDGEGEG